MEHAVLNVPERNFELLVPPRMLFEDRRHSVADCQRGQFIEAARNSRFDRSPQREPRLYFQQFDREARLTAVPSFVVGSQAAD
jgi:hypothetical protein